jgi:hypothetical protein
MDVLRAILVTVTLCVICVAGVLADVPNQFNFQGTLADSSGNPITGTKSMTFRIYADSTGGEYLWIETHGLVEVLDGLFQVQLGSVIAISETIFNGNIRWLGITVAPDIDELSPRQSLVSVPYGFTANPDNDWETGAGTMYHVAGNVGIGTAAPGYRLHVAGQAISGENSDASGLYSTISGGEDNIASGDYSVVGGGGNYGNIASGDHSTVGGGGYNTAIGAFSFIGGGGQNEARGAGATVAGGGTNSATGADATVGGGYENHATNDYATIGGGSENYAQGDASTVGGGESNVANADYSAIGGGYNNTASGSGSTVNGGSGNTARGLYSVVGGGGGSSAVDSNSAVGDYSVITEEGVIMPF